MRIGSDHMYTNSSNDLKEALVDPTIPLSVINGMKRALVRIQTKRSRISLKFKYRLIIKLIIILIGFIINISIFLNVFYNQISEIPVLSTKESNGESQSLESLAWDLYNLEESFQIKMNTIELDMAPSTSGKIVQILGQFGSSSEGVLPWTNTTILQPPGICLDDGLGIFLLIAILSLPQNLEERNAIRNHWGGKRNFRGYKTRALFFVGGGLTQELQAEQAIYNDLVVDTLEENYFLLTLKTLRVFKWFLAHCHRVKFFLKADDDSYLNPENYVDYLLREHTPIRGDFIGGLVHKKAPALRDLSLPEKLYTPRELYEPNTFPDYIAGPCYVMPGRLVQILFLKSLSTPLLHFEDVFVSGLVANKALGVQLIPFPKIRHIYGVDKYLMGLDKDLIRDLKSLKCVHPVAPNFYKML